MLENLSIQGKEYLNVEQASAYLSISKSSLYKLTSSNTVKHYKPNGKVLLFKKSDLNEYIESSYVETIEDYSQKSSSIIKNLLK